MAFELEALVGHLYIAGGRTIKTNPPGALCEVAPREAARGRETDTFFVLVLPSGNIAPNTFYEQMALMSAERYFRTTGSVTSVLRDVYNTLNNNLYVHNASGRRPYEANMMCAVLRGTDLYVARAGACTMALLQPQADDNTDDEEEPKIEIITLPEDLTDDEELFKPPLGVQPIPEVVMNRYSVENGTRLIMSDANLAEILPDNLNKTLDAEDIEKVLDDFKLLVTRQIQMIVTEFVPPEEDVPVKTVEGQSTAMLTAEIAAMKTETDAKQSATKTPDAKSKAKAPSPIVQRTRPALASASRTVGHSLMGFARVLRTLFGGKREEESSRVSRAFLFGAVVAFPTILMIVVVLAWTLNIGQTAFEECVGRVLERSEVARTIDTGNPTSVLAAWQGVLLTIEDDCEVIRPDHTDPTLNLIRLEAQDVIDRLNDISRREASLLHTFPSGSNIKSMLLQGLNVYALDDARDVVYRLQLTQDGLEAAGLAQPITQMRAGAQIDGFVLGELVDLDFDAQNDNLIVLDENGILVSCRPTFINQCDAQRLLGSENWINPIKIESWQNNFYLLDAGQEQLWRYVPSGNSYSSSPEEYFQAAIRPNLSSAVDFSISTSIGAGQGGTVYILYADGAMTSHFDGDARPFAFSGFREGQALSSVGADSFFLSDNPVNQAFYITSPRSRTIYETTLAGTHIATYRIVDESKFERLNDVAADVGQNILYAVSGNSLFALRRTE